MYLKYLLYQVIQGVEQVKVCNLFFSSKVQKYPLPLRLNGTETILIVILQSFFSL